MIVKTKTAQITIYHRQKDDPRVTLYEIFS